MHDGPDDPRVGTLLQDRYRILDRVASGGMGVVYRAERLELGRIVAIKFLHGAFAPHADFIARFEREAKTMSRLDHPHCVSVIDFGVADSPFIVMEFVAGTTLDEALADGPLPPARAIRITRQVLAGLSHAHAQGIVHRDVKPANVMLVQATGTGDHARILDFGLAKLRDADQSSASVLVGTPSYMSPEQASGRPVDARSDVYAAGLLLFELLTGDRPFRSEETLQLLRMHAESPPPLLRERHPAGAFSDELEAAVRRALAKSPDERHQTPQELAYELAEVPEVAGTPVPRPATALARVATAAAPGARALPEATGPRQRSGPRRTTLFLAVVACVAAAWLALRPPRWLAGAGDRLEEGARGIADRVERGAAPGAPPGSPSGELAEVPSLETAEALLAARDLDAALRELHALHRQNPDSAKVLLLIGDAYFAKGEASWTEAVVAYGEAVSRDPSYRTRGEVLDNLLLMLGPERTRGRARSVLLRDIGEPGLPRLRHAARAHPDPLVRREAARLAEELPRLEPR